MQGKERLSKELLLIMIAHVKGRLISTLDSTAIVEVGGIGLSISLPHRSFESLSVGEEVFFYTHFQLREDSMSLYGFQTQLERQIFQLVIGVSGIGPKVGLNILSSYPPNELIRLLLDRDVTALEHVPGIGKKTAQRLIVELSDKASKLPLDLDPSASDGTNHNMTSALELLMELGANRKEAMDTLEKVRTQENGKTLSLDELIAKSLGFLGEKRR